MIEQISIDGVLYAVTPTTAPALGDKVVTIDGVIYVIGEPVTSGRSAVPGEIDRATVNGAEFDLRDSILAPFVQANAIAIANEETRAKDAEQANAIAIANEETRAKDAEQANAIAIANEETRATAAEKALSERIDNIPTGGGGTGDIADGAVTERKLATDVAEKLNTAYNKANLADTLFVNDGITFIQGGYDGEVTEFYPGTNAVATSLAFQPNGERITVNDGYFITRYFLIYDGEVVDYDKINSNYFDTYDIAGASDLSLRIEIRKSNDTAINANEYPNIVKSFIRKPIAWYASCNMNNFICAGRYVISGSREANAQDNLPIYNAGKIEARLEVLENENTLVQILTLLNVGGGDGNIYTRVRQNGAWKPWGKLQTNIEVGRIEGNNPFDNFTDNGMYSGVYAYGSTAETFVLVVINAYLYGGGVSQLKYSTLLDGTTTVQIRTRVNDSWGEWRGLGGEVTKKEFESLQQSVNGNLKSIATLNTTIINYNRRYSIAGAVTKKQVIEDLLNRTTADRGTIVTYYAEDGWHTIQYKLNYYNPTQAVIESNWVELGGDTPIIQQTETTAEIAPNVLNLWDKVEELDIALAEADATKVNEYMFQFTSGETATTLALPNDIKWVSTPNIQANKTYQVSIINNLGVIGEFGNE